MAQLNLGVITAVRNRSEHLQITAAALSASPHHQEHLIVDWSSAPAVRRSQLPADPRIRLLQVESEELWWHSRAYNHAIRHSTADWILRCDADCVLQPAFFAALQLRPSTVHVAALPGGIHAETCHERFGLLAAPRSSLVAVGGYEPHLVGWGYEDTDLLERLFLAGHAVAGLPAVGVATLEHSDHWRTGRRQRSWLPPRFALEASHTANRLMAAWCRTHHSRTDLDDPGARCLATLPASQRQARERALLAGALSLVAGRHGRQLASRAPASLVRAAVRALALDPLAARPSAADPPPGRSGLGR